MNLYRTLNGEVFNLDKLPAKQKSIYVEVKSSYDLNIEWTEFTNLWVAKVREVLRDEEPSEIVGEPIYKICQDLDSRLGIRQGYTREPDYRDLLADIINVHFGSRYQFCKQTGIDEGYLSSILNKKKDPSLKMLQRILKKSNYQIRFVEKVGELWNYNDVSDLSAEALKIQNSCSSDLNWFMTDDAKWLTLGLASGIIDRGTDSGAGWFNICGMHYSGYIAVSAIFVSEATNMPPEIAREMLRRELFNQESEEVTINGR